MHYTRETHAALIRVDWGKGKNPKDVGRTKFAWTTCRMLTHGVVFFV